MREMLSTKVILGGEGGLSIIILLMCINQYTIQWLLLYKGVIMQPSIAIDNLSVSGEKLPSSYKQSNKFQER